MKTGNKNIASLKIKVKVQKYTLIYPIERDLDKEVLFNVIQIL